MKSRKKMLCILASLAALSSVAFAGEGETKPEPKYSLASVCGDYAAVATYGANVARALGTEIFDGKGHLTGSAIANQPGPNSTRSISRIGLNGAYSVNHDGTGKMVLTITLPGGTKATVIEDFLITRSKVIDGVEVATEMQDAQEVPSAVIDDTSLVIHTYTLRSAKSCASR